MDFSRMSMITRFSHAHHRVTLHAQNPMLGNCEEDSHRKVNAVSRKDLRHRKIGRVEQDGPFSHARHS